ncbi:Sugar transporter ERD6 [Bienertia sinuspersici]
MYFLVIQYSVFGSILTIGAMIGAILSGWIEDHFGRRGGELFCISMIAMAFSELLCIVGCLAIVFAKVAWLLDVARLLNGIGIGIFSYVAKNSRWEDREDVLKYLRGQHVDTSAEADEIRSCGQSFLIYFQTCSGFSGRVGTLALVATTVPMTVTGTVLMDRPGRRPLLMVSDFCSWILLRLLLDRIVVLVLAPILALDGVLIFPMNVKGLAGSLVTVVNWLGSWIISFAFNFLMNWNSSGNEHISLLF